MCDEYTREILRRGAEAMGETTTPEAQAREVSKALEGADEKIAEIQKYAGVRKVISEFEVLGRHSKVVESHRDYLLTLVTALSAKLKEQKAAHVKMLRDEADVYDRMSCTPTCEELRRLADKIEGGE